MKQVTIVGDFSITYEAPSDYVACSQYTLEKEIEEMLQDELRSDELSMLNAKVNVLDVHEMYVKDVLRGISI